MTVAGLTRFFLGWLCAGLFGFSAPAWASALLPPDDTCAPHILSVMAAPGNGQASVRPSSGWVPVTLPDNWAQRWPDLDGAVWYRIDWQQHCADADSLNTPVGLMLGGISMTGEIHLNDTLLWRDAQPVGAESLGWNMPRWWLLPQSSLRHGVNSLWVYTEGSAAVTPGLGSVSFGPADAIQQAHDERVWRQRTLYYISLGLSASLGMIFLVVWCLHPAERAFGWYALMSLCWVLYLYTILATTTWPFSNVLAHSRLNIFIFVLYVTCFCLFTWRFGEQHLPRTERVLWLLCLVGTACALFGSRTIAGIAWITAVLIFCANCLQFQWHAWRTRKPEHLLLALCWLTFLVIGLHDLFVVLQRLQAHETWGFISGPISGIFMALLLGGRLAFSLRRIKQFNLELQQRVGEARTELSQALARGHEQALAHAKLQERLNIVHDLHDGLGGSLVRSMALVEQTPQPLSRARTLSLLKTLRDDLRQIIDHGSSADATVPATPIQWIAPLRHRFTHLFDEMDIRAEWRMDEHWRVSPSALQCLGMTRVVEEALSNLIKHSHARTVSVTCRQAEDGTLTLEINDDGVGFDLEAVRKAGQSVGMRSMAARAERLGGKIHVQSGVGGTRVALTVKVIRNPNPEADTAETLATTVRNTAQ